MGTIIKATAAPEKIIDAAKTTMRRAEAAGGVAKEGADKYLAEPLIKVEVSEQEFRTAQSDVEDASIKVDVADGSADGTIGSIRDEIWNILGRPKFDATMDFIYPGGIKTYTRTNIQNQPIMMQVLGQRIESADNKLLTDEKKAGWLGRIKTDRENLSANLGPLSQATGLELITEAGFRSAARNVRQGMVRLKRFLKNEDWSDSQIHKIIPSI